MMRLNCLLLFLSLFLFASLLALAFGDHSGTAPQEEEIFPRMVTKEILEEIFAGMGHKEIAEEILAGMGPKHVNINDGRVKEIAEFAVSEFNKESLKSLVFHKAVSGLVQLVEGRMYTLVIAVRDESLPASPIVNYQGRVHERLWMDDPLTLSSFHQVFL